MTDGFDLPLVSPVMVGREGHLAALRRGVDAARDGEGQVVLVAGEAGIGKSRLVGEAGEYARGHGMRMLTGQCFAADRALPYAPLRDLIRSDVLGQPWAEEVLTAAGPDLGVLLPEGVRSRFDSRPGSPGGAEPDRRRVGHAFRELVEAIAAEEPVLLVFEDAHWSDEASLDLLVQLARFVRGERRPVAIVVTYRDDEVTPDLAAALAALDRGRLAAEARLGHLPRAEVMAMLRALLRDHGPGPVNASLAETIYRLSEGNPFFVEELLRSALVTGSRGNATAAGGGSASIPLPRSVEEAVRQRAGLLSDGARRTLTLAAVSGRRFDFALLLALGGGDEARLIDEIKELIAARLVVEESADRFAFRHALMREAIYEGLLARERRALHRQALDGILRADPNDTEKQAADLARHAVGAGAWAEAITFGQRAGEQALALFAPGAAIELLGHAIAASGQLGLAPSPGLPRSRGQAHETRGDFEAARADYETAAELARAAGSREEESEALLALGGLWAGRDYERSGEWIQQSLELARRGDDRVLLARALNRLGNWHANRDEMAEALRLHQEALALAEASGDRRGIAEALDLLGIARYLAEDYVGSAAEYRRAMPLLRELDDRQTLITGLAMLALTMGNLDNSVTVPAAGDGAISRNLVEEAIALAKEIDARPDEAFARCTAAIVIGDRDVEAGLDHAGRALRIAEEIGHQQWTIYAHVSLGYLYTALLDVEASRSHFDAALTIAGEVGSAFWMRTVLASLARVMVLGGDLDGAERAIAEAMPAGVPMETGGQRSLWFARAEIVLGRGDATEALAIVDRLIAAATTEGRAGLTRLPELARVRGEALGALGRTDEANDALDAARDGARERGHHPFLWRTFRARAALFRRLGRRDEAEADLAAAHAAVMSFAAGIADAAMREAFVGRAAALLPSQRVPTRSQAAKAAAGGLTAREREVVILIAAGRSNREIGDALFMSARTAGTHVGNILGKLGVKTRAQVAAWAQEHGLTGDGASL